MDIAWGGSWIWGLLLITVTTAGHALGIVTIMRGLQWSGELAMNRERRIKHPMAAAVVVIAIVGLLLATLHGVEAAVWAKAFLWLGAIDSLRDAMLYSLDSFTTRGSSGLSLDPEWRLLGALESADGMLLFGISTAFVFSVMQRVIRIVDELDQSLR